MNDQAIIACHQLAKSFVDGDLNVTVLTDLNLKIAAREKVAIVGSSGAGKSTLLHILGGLDKPSAGVIKINGTDISQLSETQRSAWRNKYLGFIYQFHHLLPEFTALENVCMPLLIANTSIAIAKEKAMNLLNKVGLSKRYQHKPGELSGGEKQRVAIARALVTEPLCLLADEPTGNLDHRTASQVYETMLQLNEEINTSIVMVTHDLILAKKMQRCFVLEEGHLKPIIL